MRTGPLTAVLVGGALRDVRVAGHRALDAVYAAVRDAAWGTIPGEVTGVEVSDGDDGFLVSFDCRHGGDYEWRGRVTGRGGTVWFDFDGVARRGVSTNRVGFCLLHPIELAGHPVSARTGSGTRIGRFPDRIAAHQPFVDLVGLGYEVAPGARVELTFHGDLFEMEDHRNWTDAGYKTYCTPLRQPYPVRHLAGDRVHQRIEIAAAVRGTVREPVAAAPSVVIRDGVRARVPEISVRAPGPARMTRLFAEVTPDGLAGLAGLADVDRELDVAVLAAPGMPAEDLAAALLPLRGRLIRVAVYSAQTGLSAPGSAAALRSALDAHGVAVPVGGGTVGNFAELNRMDLDPSDVDFVTYGVNPRVHHDDPDLVMDTLLAQPHTVRDARLIAGGKPVVVRVADPGGDPDFAAAWTLGSLAALAGADVLTLASLPDPLVRFLDLVGSPVYAVDVSGREVAALAVDGLVLLANLRPVPRVVEVDGRPVSLGRYVVTELPR